MKYSNFLLQFKKVSPTWRGKKLATLEFTLLLPVYKKDTPEFFLRALHSSDTEQKLAPTEIVIVRDGEVPEELENVLKRVEKANKKVKVVRLPENLGLARALNAGLEQASHEIIARIDADDISMPERFAKQVPQITEGFDLIGSAMLEFETNEEHTIRTRNVETNPVEIAKISRFKSPFNHPSVVYRKSAVQQVGGYREMGKMEDYWLWARLIKADFRVGNIADALVKYRVGAGAYTRRGGIAQWESEKMIQKAFREIGFTTKWQYFRNILIRGSYRFIPTPVRKLLYRNFVAS